MADSIARSLRDGALEGEHAPALTIKDSLRIPLGSRVFDHFLSSLVSNIAAGKSQAKVLVLVAFSRSPAYYADLLSKGPDASQSVKILDCNSDPLGWKERVLRSGSDGDGSVEGVGNVFTDVRNVDKLLNAILELGRGSVGQSKARFAVSIDSVSHMLRHASLVLVAGLINNLRNHDHISSIFWLIHSDLHELRVSKALEYISSMVSCLEPMITDGQSNAENSFWFEQNSQRGKFHVRLKRRNGRVKPICEEVRMEQGCIKFAVASSDDTAVNQNLLPKVQFNLQLSEKERTDRAKVILPFEHQGNGETIQIYDGRRSLTEGQKEPGTLHPTFLAKKDSETNDGNGEIHYIRDSDDEMPDSDEDPDDDLEI